MIEFPKTIQEVQDLLAKGHGNHTDDALQYLWNIHRNGKSDEGPMVKYFGFVYRDATPKIINENNLEFIVEEFSTHTIILLNHGEITDRKLIGDPEAPIVYVKYKGNYHMIDGNRRIRYWCDHRIDGPHKVCILAIK